MSKGKQLPTGTLAEISINLINRGEFVQEVNNKIREGHAALKEHYRRTGSKKGKVVIGMRLEMAYDPKIDGHVAIDNSIDMKVPKISKATLIKEREGKLLVRPEGDVDIDQLHLFDEQGHPLGTYDEESGKIKKETPEIAGAIGG